MKTPRVQRKIIAYSDKRKWLSMSSARLLFSFPLAHNSLQSYSFATSIPFGLFCLKLSYAFSTLSMQLSMNSFTLSVISWGNLFSTCSSIVLLQFYPFGIACENAMNVIQLKRVDDCHYDNACADFLIPIYLNL